MIKTSHQALYRTYRPQTFDDVVEQQHIVTTLKNAVMSKKVAHAYLFCGTRGTGKTTMAKIFARAVNCLNPADGNPCNECEICKGIIDGTLLDVAEIDAASNNSVDNIRSIIDEVVYSPTRAFKKVYIIDEVHMLSIGAFNALLKTLEEPPEHVMFILATTEPHKLPATVLSRCQRFDFRRITSGGIAKRLMAISKECGVTLTDNAASFIASLSEGALRDGISILDQCISTGKEPLDLESVQNIIGVAPNTVIIDTIDSLIDRKSSEAISKIDLIFSEGKDAGQFIHKLIQFLRDILVYKTTKSFEYLYSVTEEERKAVQYFAEKISMTLGLSVIRELSDLQSSIKWSSSQRILMEMVFLRICAREIINEDENLLERIKFLEDRIRSLESGVLIERTDNSNLKSVSETVYAKKELNDTVQVVDSEKATDTAEEKIPDVKTTDNAEYNSYSEWGKVLKEISSIGRMKLYGSLLGTSAVWVDENTIGIVLQEEDEFKNRVINENDNNAVIKDAIKRCSGKEVRVVVLGNEKENKHDSVMPEKFFNFVKKKGLTVDIIED